MVSHVDSERCREVAETLAELEGYVKTAVALLVVVEVGYERACRPIGLEIVGEHCCGFHGKSVDNDVVVVGVDADAVVEQSEVKSYVELFAGHEVEVVVGTAQRHERLARVGHFVPSPPWTLRVVVALIHVVVLVDVVAVNHEVDVLLDASVSDVDLQLVKP